MLLLLRLLLLLLIILTLMLLLLLLLLLLIMIIIVTISIIVIIMRIVISILMIMTLFVLGPLRRRPPGRVHAEPGAALAGERLRLWLLVSLLSSWFISFIVYSIRIYTHYFVYYNICLLYVNVEMCRGQTPQHTYTRSP